MCGHRGTLSFALGLVSTGLVLTGSCRPSGRASEEPPPEEARSALAAVELVENGDGSAGILVVAPEGAVRANYDVYAADGESPLSQAHSVGERFTVEPGRYRITEYFNGAFVWAENLPVEAGKTTRLRLGALRVAVPEGSEKRSWDLWTAGGAEKIDQANEIGGAIPVPAGTFTVKEYFSPEVIADGVTVRAGEITELGR